MASPKRSISVKDDNKSFDSLPEITKPEKLDWPEHQARPTKYKKYDGIKVGEAILGLTKMQAESVRTRLKKLGYTMVSKQLSATAFGLKREA